MKRLIFIISLCFVLCICIVACDNLDAPAEDLPKEDENTSLEVTVEDDTPYVNIEYDMSLVAYLYITADDPANVTRIFIDYTDGQLRIEDVLFDQITYTENVEVKPAESYHFINPDINIKYTVLGTENEAKVAALMNRLALQKNCYLIDSSEDNDLAEYIAAYYIDEMCHLVFFDENGIAFRVYSMEVENPEPIFTDGMELRFKHYAICNALSSPDYATISVKGNEIYYAGEFLFNVKYFNGMKINTEWCREAVVFVVEHSEGMELIDRLNEEKGCFVIYCAGEQPFRCEIAVYIIDGVYYSLDVTDCSRSNIYITRMNYYDGDK